MSFLMSILTLVSVVFVIGFPYFVGHGLALHQTNWIFAGIGCGIVAAILIFTVSRIRPGTPDGDHHAVES